MSNANEGIFSCKGISWIVGGLLAIAAFLILRGRWDMGFILALIIALVVLIGAAYVLRTIFCAGVNTDMSNANASSGAAGSSPVPTAAPVGNSATSPKPAAAPAEISKKPAPSTEVPSGASGGSKAAANGKQSSSKTTKAEKAPSKKSPVKKPAAKKPVAKKSATSTSKTTSSGKKPARAPVAADGKPAVLTAPRAGGGDDLKQLKGVGPALEKTLNELGFYHFDQIAAWRKKEVEWVDSRLRFKGRIERDEWIKQAKVLAKGGSTEFSKKVKKGGLY